jgi:DeoR/GlpR family transcriptional regulator of sugar metabolism
MRDPDPRRLAILETVLVEGQVPVARLAERLGVSQVTIRKDLDELESRGLIRRERGCAAAASRDDPASRMALRYAEKRRIAKAAAATVAEGEMVMIEAGSCCTLLAEEIAATRPGTTIVTNSAFTAGRVRHAPHARVVLLGGDYQPESQALVGPVAEMCARQFYVDKLFSGTNGFTQEAGFTGRDLGRAAMVRAMAARSGRVLVVTEADKFGRRGAVPLLAVDEVSEVFTDARLSRADHDHLVDRGVTVHTVDARPQPLVRA